MKEQLELWHLVVALAIPFGAGLVWAIRLESKVNQTAKETSDLKSDIVALKKADDEFKLALDGKMTKLIEAVARIEGKLQK